MYLMRRLLVILSITLCFLRADGADKYTDEKRPYEFGFTIDEEQHRHEKKDENGIIMGEFGFITADGVYHVTVYATDENGNFKILSMKNIRKKPYPTSPQRKGNSLPFPPSSPSDPKPPPPVIARPVPSLPARTCSSCSLPSTTKPPPPAPIPPQLTNIAAVSHDNQYPNNSPQQNYQRPPTPKIQSSYQRPPQVHGELVPQNFAGTPQLSNAGRPYQNNAGSPKSGNVGVSHQSNYGSVQRVPNQNNVASRPQTGIARNPQQNSFGNTQHDIAGNPHQQGAGSPPQQGSFNKPINPPQAQQPGRNPNYQSQSGNRERSPKRYEPSSPHNAPLPSNPPTKPVLISAQMQIVDKKTDIYKRGPGEKEGLPKGLTKDSMTTLLYTFNYTVGFHGHHEEGYTNGAKKGYYYVTGRNGVRTRVDYEADENGFRPKITQEVLDIVSEEVPKPETEKDAKYGLKGYEFKWLYYPTEAKHR